MMNIHKELPLSFPGCPPSRTPHPLLHKYRDTTQTYYRWRREYGGMKVSQARRLKELERENGRLKRAVADLTLDKLIVEEAAKGNF